MKKILVVVASLALLVGCGAGDERKALRSKCEANGGTFNDFSTDYDYKYFCTIDGKVYKLSR